MTRKIPETITAEELLQILQNTKRKNHRVAFVCGFYQAMRISEVTNLTQDNIDMTGNVIKIKQGKGQKDRNIPIAPEAKRFLKHIPVNCGIRALEMAFKKKAMEVLNKDLHFHTLRHSGATHYLNVKKWNIRFVQQFLGHADLSTTMIYTHVSPQDLMNAMMGDE